MYIHCRTVIKNNLVNTFQEYKTSKDGMETFILWFNKINNSQKL